MGLLVPVVEWREWWMDAQDAKAPEEGRVVVVGSLKNLLLSGLMLVGPFAFVQTLLFRPRMLTPYMAGEGLLVSVELQTLGAVIAFFLGCSAAGRLRGAVASVVSLGIGVGIPIACIVLIGVVRALWIPPVVALALGFACGALLRLTLGRRLLGRRAALEDYAWSTLMSLGVSSLLVHGGYATSSNDANGTIALAALVLFSGILVGVAELRGRLSAARYTRAQPRSGGASAGGEEVPGAVVPDGRDLDQLLREALPVAPAGLICSLSLGTALMDPSVEAVVRSPWPFAGGALVTVAFLVVVALRWRALSEEQSSEILLLMTVPCALGIAATVMTPTVSFGVVYGMIAGSNLMFLALLWIDTLALAARRTFARTALPIMALGLVLVMFCLGMLISGMVPLEYYRIMVPVATLVYLMYLVFYFQRALMGPLPDARLRACGEPGAAAPTFAEMRTAACDSLAGDFALSPKEAEVLPLLVTGLSAAAIGRQLFISHETVKTHKYHIYQKCNVHNFEEMVGLFERYTDKPVIPSSGAAGDGRPSTSGSFRARSADEAVWRA